MVKHFSAFHNRGVRFCFRLSVSLFVCLSVCLSFSLSDCLSACLSFCLSVCLSIERFACLCLSLPVCQSLSVLSLSLCLCLSVSLIHLLRAGLTGLLNRAVVHNDSSFSPIDMRNRTLCNEPVWCFSPILCCFHRAGLFLTRLFCRTFFNGINLKCPDPSGAYF